MKTYVFEGSMMPVPDHSATLFEQTIGKGKNGTIKITVKVLTESKESSVKTYVNLFRNSYIPLISKPTRIFKTNATIIDHINTNNFLETDIKTGILKSIIRQFSSICNF